MPVALARCKPLADPVQFVAGGMRNIALLFLILGGVALVGNIETLLKDPTFAMPLAASIVGSVAFPLAVWVLLGNAGRIQIIYLRAFRTDVKAKRLRRLLKTALGSRFRLCGIRPPRKRSWWFIHAFAQLWIALRYAGSPYFDLQAEDRNWMARLLASYARTRFVFIDVRDLTPHVENEIRLSYLAMGPDRCIFIIDPPQTNEEWITKIHQLLGLGESEQPTLQLLSYPGDAAVEADSFVPAARDLIDRIPEGRPEISEEAVAMAKSNVSENAWRTRFWETDAGMRWSAVALSFIIFVPLFVVVQMTADLAPPGNVKSSVLLAATVLQLAFSLFALFVIVAIFVSYFIAWGRAWSQARFERRFRRAERSPSWRLSVSMLLVLIFLGIIAFGAWAGNRKNRSPDLARLDDGQTGSTPTTMKWNGLSLTLPTNYQQIPSEDETTELLFLMGNDCVCDFKTYPRSRMRASVPTDIEQIVDFDLQTLRSAGLVVRELERRRSDAPGYDVIDVHANVTNTDGSKCPSWIRFANFPDRLVIVKVARCDAPDDDATLKRAFDQAQTAWRKADQE